MRFSLVIQGHRQAHDQAIAFAQAVIAQSHQLELIFFHDQGVLSALNQHADSYQTWLELAQQQPSTAIKLCINSAKQHAIHQDHVSTTSKVTLGSLVDLIEAEANSDRIIVFKDAQ